MNEPASEVILYRSDDGQSAVQLRAVGGTVWLTQSQLAELYDTSVPNIVQIIGRVLADGEVGEATINSELRVRTEGSREVRRRMNVYNLGMAHRRRRGGGGNYQLRVDRSSDTFAGRPPPDGAGGRGGLTPATRRAPAHRPRSAKVDPARRYCTRVTG